MAVIMFFTAQPAKSKKLYFPALGDDFLALLYSEVTCICMDLFLLPMK